MVCELQFSRPIGLLHGALLSSGKSGEGTKGRQLILNEALKEVLKRASEEEKRRVNLFLFINTDVGWKEELHSNDAFSALVGLVEPPIEVEQYFEAVEEHGLWSEFLELLRHLPAHIISSLPPKLPSRLPYLPQVAGIVTACKGKGHLSLPLMREAIADLGRRALDRDTLGKKEGRAISLATILATLRSLVSAQGGFQRDWRQLYAFEGAFDKSGDELTEEIASLLLLLKAFLVDFSTLHWVDMVEVPSNVILQHTCLAFWQGNHPPSNMQLLCAHIASELLPLLSWNNLAKEVAIMLSPLSSSYTREVELGLADRDVKEMIASLSKLEEKWQQEAIVAHIMSERLSEVTFPATTCGSTCDAGGFEAPPGPLEAVAPDLLTQHMSPLLDLLLGETDREIGRSEAALVMKVASNMGEELLVKVIEEEVAKRGVHTRLCPPDLHTMFTACINKASLEAGAQQEAKTRETKEDFLRLGLVGGARIIRLLLEEAAKHKGQAASVAGILSLLHPICSHKVGGGSRTLLPVFIGGMLSKEEEGNNEDGSVNQPKKNLVGLCLALLKLRPSYTEDLLLTCLPQLLNGQDLLAASFMDQVLRLSSSVCQLQTSSCLTLGTAYVHLLNCLSHASVAEPLNLKLKELCLSSLRRLLSKKDTKAQLEKCMSKSSISYYQPSLCSDPLLSQIHSAYFGSPASSSLSFSLSTLPLILPQLMPKEWDILLAVLLQNENVKDTREGLQQITDSLLSLLPHLSSPQRRALLLSYSTILAKEGGEESVEELCILLNVLQENEEEASLLWTALQSLLSSKEEIKEETFAWLRALPRSEGRDTAVKILLQRDD